ncbi:MAG: sensor domain-containing diguanylate cyclase [bacterium]|nr:sensor domain-containing diguanylate cyclase [bacterium]
MEDLIIFTIIFIVYVSFLIIFKEKFYKTENATPIFLIFSFLSILFGNYFGGIFKFPVIIYIFSIIYFSGFLSLKYSVAYILMLLLIEILPPVYFRFKQDTMEILNLPWENVFLFAIASVSGMVTGNISQKFLKKMTDEYERIFSGRITKSETKQKIIKKSKEEFRQETELSFEENIKELFSALKNSIGFSGIFLFLLEDNENQILKLQHYLSDYESDINLNNEITQDNPPISLVLKERIPIIISDSKTDSINLGYYLNSVEIKSIIALPIMNGREIRGILACDSKQKQFFTENHKEILLHTINIIKSLLFNYTDLVRFHDQANEFNILYKMTTELSATPFEIPTEISIDSPLKLESVYDKLGNFFSNILKDTAEQYIPLRVIGFYIEDQSFYSIKFTSGKFSFDPRILKEKRFKIEKDTIFKSIFEHKKPIWRYLKEDESVNLNLEYLEKTDPETRSFLAIPLKAGEKILGVFLLEYVQEEIFSKYELKIMSITGEHSGTIIENINLYNTMSNLAKTDGLTGLPNHRIFQERLEEGIKRALRNNKPLSLMLMDIDFFKKFNDNYGHSTGDAVLRAVSQVIREDIREVDFPARYGGEEFVIILEETNKKKAFDVGERIRHHIEKSDFFLNNQHLKITISAGIAEFPTDTADKKELIELADSALYKAKKNGRNRLEIFSKG